MQITKLILYPACVPRRYTTVIAQEGGNAKHPVDQSHFFFLELSTNTGLTGWGEISDIEPSELPNAHVYEELLQSFVIGRNPFDIQRMHREFRDQFPPEVSPLGRLTSCALDMAMYDLQGKATARPVWQLLGGAVREQVVISWVAYIREDLELIRDEIRERTAEGFTAFKLKVGVDIELDEARLAATREVAGEKASVKVDANEGWSISEAASNIKRLARFGLDGVESPVPRENPADIAVVRRQVDVPILEHVADISYGLSLIKADAVDVFNLATTGSGGLWPARQISVLAQSAGIGILLGSTVEMGPGTLGQLQLAATIERLALPSDLIGPGMYTSDILVEPLSFERGTLRIPRGAGLGGTVDKTKLLELSH